MANAEAVVTTKLIQYLFINPPANIGTSPSKKIQNTDFLTILNASLTHFSHLQHKVETIRINWFWLSMTTYIRMTHLQMRYMCYYVVAYLTKNWTIKLANKFIIKNSCKSQFEKMTLYDVVVTRFPMNVPSSSQLLNLQELSNSACMNVVIHPL